MKRLNLDSKLVENVYNNRIQQLLLEKSFLKKLFPLKRTLRRNFWLNEAEFDVEMSQKDM